MPDDPIIFIVDYFRFLKGRRVVVPFRRAGVTKIGRRRPLLV
jgi:hypothetical protein